MGGKMKLTDFIKPEHLPGWEYVATANGAPSLEEYAQTQFDALGVSYITQRQAADAATQRQLFEIALRLSGEKRAVIRDKVLELAASEGLI